MTLGRKCRGATWSQGQLSQRSMRKIFNAKATKKDMILTGTIITSHSTFTGNVGGLSNVFAFWTPCYYRFVV